MPPLAPVTSNPFFNLQQTLAQGEGFLGEEAGLERRLFASIGSGGRMRAPSLSDFAKANTGIGLSKVFSEGWIPRVKGFMKLLSDLMKIGTSNN